MSFYEVLLRSVKTGGFVLTRRIMAEFQGNKRHFGLPLLGTIVTALVRSTSGGYVFTGVCLSNFRGGEVAEGVPHPRSGFGGGGVALSSWLGGTLLSGPGMGYPLSRSGPRSGWGYPRQLVGVPPSPPPPHLGRQSSIASTCYAAGGMILSFTQVDFLVLQKNHFLQIK